MGQRSSLPRRGALRVAGSALLTVAGAAAGLSGSATAADLPSVIASIKTSVMPVGTYNATGNPRFEFRGTGFVVGDGTLVATNFHVLPDGAEVESGPQMAVLANRGSGGEAPVRRARVVATDRLRDLVLLQIEGPPLAPLTLAEAGAAREGQGIALLGFPIGGTLGFSVVTHRGIVASLTTVALPAPTARQLDPRAVSRLREGNFEVLQLDATAYPGNSGGPVIDAETGVVLGVVNQVLVKSSRESALSNPTGITYAIPVALLRNLMRDLALSRTETGKAP
jgi:S1-C subfamily serine protease